MARRKAGPSQLMVLFLTVAKAMGYTDDRDIAQLAGVLSDNVSGWRTGAVKEFKRQTLEAVKDSRG